MPLQIIPNQFRILIAPRMLSLDASDQFDGPLAPRLDAVWEVDWAADQPVRGLYLWRNLVARLVYGLPDVERGQETCDGDEETFVCEKPARADSTSVSKCLVGGIRLVAVS
ncbi:hypothetical protein CMUS01_13101 [Colletotrichum musicola]|uniref:Uncharacterized protein n=1 Tax=Colletotrichum musicola TaxID=2175873 RepID=A0A8H6JG24_9PEZI|nr:hypothetical protein CMUS01_13101 [Colletotrichum musicola]